MPCAISALRPGGKVGKPHKLFKNDFFKESCEFPLDYTLSCRGWGLWWDCILISLTRFDVGIFSFTQCVGVTHSVSGFLSEGSFAYGAVDSVCPWQQLNSGASYVATLDWNLPVQSFNVVTASFLPGVTRCSRFIFYIFSHFFKKPCFLFVLFHVGI